MDWYEDEVKRLELEKANWPIKPSTVFYGSSSIRSWHNLSHDFAGYSPVNMGFGGSTLAACVWFFDRLFTELTPASMIIYAGDNDLSDGATPESVFILFKELVNKAHDRFGRIPIGYISIKPSVSRLDILDRIKKANDLIETEIKERRDHLCFINIFDNMLDENGKPIADYFEEDGLHINQQGYSLWKKRIYTYISNGDLKI